MEKSPPPVGANNLLSTWSLAARIVAPSPPNGFGWMQLMSQNDKDERLLTLPKVMERTTYGRSSIYAMIARGEFPPPVVIGPNKVAWRESAVAEWIAAKIAAAA